MQSLVSNKTSLRLAELSDCGKLPKICIDSRVLSIGDIFVAIRGDNYDGHDFVSEALQKGAKAVVIEHQINSVPLDKSIIVTDTIQFLTEVAAARRANFNGVVFGVTGSNGKTTVKEMLVRVLREKGKVLLSQGNFNNHIGVPLSLLGLSDEHQYAVIEMGANHIGEINNLAKIVRPDVAILTTVNNAHVSEFGNIEAIRETKSEIFSYLDPSKANSLAVINAEDTDSLPLLIDKIGSNKKITFGLHKGEVHAGNVSIKDNYSTFDVIYRNQPLGSFKLNLLGLHNVINALSVVAAVYDHLPLVDIFNGLSSFTPVVGRLEPKRGILGSKVIDDTYNSSPKSVDA